MESDAFDASLGNIMFIFAAVFVRFVYTACKHGKTYREFNFQCKHYEFNFVHVSNQQRLAYTQLVTKIFAACIRLLSNANKKAYIPFMFFFIYFLNIGC